MDKAIDAGSAVVDTVMEAVPKSKKALKAAAKAAMKASKRAVKQPPKKALSDVYTGVRVAPLHDLTDLRHISMRYMSDVMSPAAGHGLCAAEAPAPGHPTGHTGLGAVGAW